MTATATATAARTYSEFWMEDLGGVNCAEHMGGAAKAAIASRPRAHSHRTYGPQGVITQMTTAEAEEFLAYVATIHAEIGKPAPTTICETCRYTAQR